MGLFARLLRRLRRSETEADTSVKTPHVTCPKCKHNWARKPSKTERLAGMAEGISIKQLLYIYRNYCVGCDKRFKDIDEATIDHIKPKAKGGVNGLANYQLLCKRCNLKKGMKYREHDPHWNPTVKLKHLVEVNDLLASDNKPS